MALEPGSVLHDRYRIDGQLGKGGMGAVYLAFDQRLGIKVAVKENLNPNPESERQFRREAELLAQLRHPNLPRVTDHFVIGEQQYLVMDFVEGIDLHSRAIQSPPTVAEVLAWTDGVCDGLAYLHSRTLPVIHRDIKPANLKLQPDGRVILVDFGIAKTVDQTQTTNGARGLTPGFSPPEQYGGTSTDHRTDQYALAATTYSLLTGQRPADSMERMFKKEPLKSAGQLNPSVPPHVDSALTRALALDPAERFPDIVTFRSALRGELEMGTVVARAPTVPARRRSPLPWIALGAFARFLLLGGAGLIVGRALFPADNEPTARPTLPIVALAPSDTPAPSPTSPPSAVPSITTTAQPSPTLTLTPTATTPPVLLGGSSLIVFVSKRGEGSWLQLWTMNPDGSRPTQLTFGPGDKSQPKWSPDGTRIAYVTTIEGNADIFVMNADGTDPTNLTNDPAGDTDPAWSPEGDRLTFTSTRVNNLRQVFIMDISCPPPSGGAPGEPCTAGKPRNLSAGYAVEYSPVWAPRDVELPSWIPIGLRVAVAVSINQAAAQIYLRDPAGGVPTDFDRGDEIVGVDHLDWSPDGQFVAFTWIQPTMNEIYVARLADRGRNRERLTFSLGNKEPAFSPDGKWILFTSTRDQNPEIYLMTVNGGDQRNLTESPGIDMQPDWRPVP